MEIFSFLVLILIVQSRVSGLTWTTHTTTKNVEPGGNITLRWTYTLTNFEQQQASLYSLIIIEQERYLYSGNWRTLAVKLPEFQLSKVISNNGRISFQDGAGVGIEIYNVTDIEETRYRCTYISGFPSSKSIIVPDFKEVPIQLRIIGNSLTSGRVEVFHNGLWGTICNNKWTIRNANVACRMMGFQGASKALCIGQCTPGTGPIWLSDVDCTGNENNLGECFHGVWGNNKCNHNMDAGVECVYPSTTKITFTTSTIQPPSTTQPLTTTQPTTTTTTRGRSTTQTPSTTKPQTTTQPPTTTQLTTNTQRPITRSSIILARLTGANRNDYGRLEVFYNGEWGTVCDDNWNEKDAIVACRMLGFQTVNFTATVGSFMPGQGKIHMDEVQCIGNETSLKDCPFIGWDQTDCGHKEDVGVSCMNVSTKTTAIPTTQATFPTTAPQPEVRLAGANSVAIGRLEVYHNHSWGTVCYDNWDSNDAIVVCRQLGFDFVKHTERVIPALEGKGVIWMDEVKCNGTERSLKDCPFNGWGKTDCGHDKDVLLWCKHFQSTTFAPSTAQPTTTVPTTAHTTAPTTAQPTTTVPTTAHTTAPTTARPTTTISTQPIPEVRLAGVNTSAVGRVEVYHNHSWGTVCYDNWDSNDAIVVCRQLGFDFVKQTGRVIPALEGKGVIWMDEVKCNGTERSLKDCPFNGWGKTDCGHDKDVLLWCGHFPSTTFAPTTAQPTTTAPTTAHPTTTISTQPNPEVRLAGVNTSAVGRVEVYHNRSWGTVCYDNWDSNDAIVVCRQLGFDFVKQTGRVIPALEGKGVIWMDEVKCNGTERSLKDCPFNGWGKTDCGHDKDVLLWCGYFPTTTSAPSTAQPTTVSTQSPVLQIRLAGNTSSFGRIEVFYNGTWGTVCSNYWDVNAGKVACRMLGYPYVWSSSSIGSLLPGTGKIWLDDVRCHGNETTILDCAHKPWGEHNCNHSRDAGVWCGRTPTPSPPPRTTTTSLPMTTSSPPSTASPTPSLRIRLAGRNSFTEGRVEIFQNNAWGTICDDKWDINDAHVVCRMLGLSGAERAVVNAEFGEGTGMIWMDDVECSGSELSLVSCKHKTNSDCSHKEDAGVVCQKVPVQNKDAGCNFDHKGYCYWNRDTFNGSNYEWTRISGPTPSDGTGPSKDRTTGKGHYVYIESTDCMYGKLAARLVSPLLGKSATCLSFHYHMYGAKITTLRVTSGKSILWQLTGEQGQKWFKARVPLKFAGTFHVSFEADCGLDWRGDIAIDDIVVLDDPDCRYYAESAVPSKIVSISGNVTVDAGADVFMSCSASGAPTPSVEWVFDNKVLAKNPSQVNYTVKINDLSQAGQYLCIASNKYGTMKNAMNVFLRHKPMNTTTNFNVSSNAASVGEPVSVICKAVANPIPTCELYHNGNLLNMISNSYVIKTFKASDFGVYKCSCFNSLGRDSGVETLTVYEKPSISVVYPRSQNISETDPINIFCNATGNPHPTITWRKSDDSRRVFPTGSFLTIPKSLAPRDEGNFICTADNGKYSTEDSSVVNFVFRVSRISSKPQNVSAIEDSNRLVSLFCNATGIPSPNITWYKQGNYSFPVALGETLKLRAKKEASGIYECVAFNGIGSAQRTRAWIQIKHIPYFTTMKSNVNNDVVFGNHPITITCTSFANPPANRYVFYRDGRHVSTTSSGVLTIVSAKAADQGIYTCISSNSIGRSANNATLSVAVFGALEIASRPKNQTVKESGTAILFCNASSSHGTVQIEWRKVENRSISFPSVTSLVLANAQKGDNGVYECKASNGYAKPVTARARVNVLHKPYNTVLNTSTGSKNIRLNGSLQLICKTFANPPANIYKFFHNGVTLGQTANGVFKISRLTKTSNGTYSCVAENAIGKGAPGSIFLKFAVCGRPVFGNSIHSQIVGGITSRHGAWPWQVQIGTKNVWNSIRHLCGGSVIGKKWIVTAAHCVAVEQGSGFNTTKPENLNITLGEQFIYKVDGTEQNIPVEKVIVHPSYYNLDYDIALIKLKQDIQYNSYVSPVCLPDFEFPAGTACYVTGWGRLFSSSPSSNVLQEASIPLMSRSQCNVEYKGIKQVTSRMICAGTKGVSKGTCRGDSGGPIVCSREGYWFLMGATSWSLGGCADSGYPGVYADIFYFKNWIVNTMERY